MSNETAPKVGVLYEDEACLVLDKPAGLMVHPDGRNGGPFLTDWIKANRPGAMGVGEQMRSPDGQIIDRPGIVHRLDKDTSGAIVVAKTPEAHAFLKKQFQGREVSKKYLAFVWGELKEEFGTIDKPIGRSPGDFPRWSASRGARGEMREAETYWTRLWTGQTTDGSGRLEKFSLIQAEPKTGRTHQIRVHFQAVQHPVVCDELYAPKKPAALGFERLALHSWRLGFKTPATGQAVRVEAPFPGDFEHALMTLKIKLS